VLDTLPPPAESRPSVPAPIQPAPPTGVVVSLDARDPFSLVAHWDAEPASLDRFFGSRLGDTLRLRVYAHYLGGVLMADQIVTSSAQHRLVPVLYTDTLYFAELGWVDSEGNWCGLATSAPRRTPPDTHANGWTERRARYQSSLESSTADAFGSTTKTKNEDPSPGQTSNPQPLKSTNLPPAVADDLLDESIALALTALVWEPTPVIFSPGNSAEVTQWVAHVISLPRGVTGELPPSPTSAELPGPIAVPTGVENPPSSPSIPLPLPPPPSSFWFKVNAELILYGSTEPDATVTVAGRPVQLRDDGSFSFRFSLPDGQFELPAVAVKADRSDGGTARLSFSRATELTGEVGIHPQDPSLSPPVAEAIH